MVFDLQLTEDVLLSPGTANMAFDLWPTEDVLSWPGYANMAFDLRPTEDVLPWPGNANMAFNLRPMEDVLSWPNNANMAFDLRPTEDVLPWHRVNAAIWHSTYGRRKTYFHGRVPRLMISILGSNTSKCKYKTPLEAVKFVDRSFTRKARGRNGDAVGDRGYQKIKYV
ncbi:hypothetical protein Tco_0007572 [Tanacetum coccineum]